MDGLPASYIQDCQLSLFHILGCRYFQACLLVSLESAWCKREKKKSQYFTTGLYERVIRFDRKHGECVEVMQCKPLLTLPPFKARLRTFSCSWHGRTWLLPVFARKIKEMLVSSTVFCSGMWWEENESLAFEETFTICISRLYPNPDWSSHSLSGEKTTCTHRANSPKKEKQPSICNLKYTWKNTGVWK